MNLCSRTQSSSSTSSSFSCYLSFSLCWINSLEGLATLSVKQVLVFWPIRSERTPAPCPEIYSELGRSPFAGR